MAVSDFGCVNRICAEESEGNSHGGVGLDGLDRGEMSFGSILPCKQLRLQSSSFCRQAQQAMLAFFGVAMICTMDLAVPAKPHFSLAGCDTWLSSTSISIAL